MTFHSIVMNILNIMRDVIVSIVGGGVAVIYYMRENITNLRILKKICLFLISYFPLSYLLIFRKIDLDVVNCHIL